jgi:hypothetical protein
MSLHLQPACVATGSDDNEGQLVFVEGLLVAVLVHLSEQHDGNAGMWFLEAGFGRIAVPDQPTFGDLDEAQAWITQRLGNAYVS